MAGLTDALPVLIAGGGIGGLATACGLAQQGIASMVLEQAAQFGEIGAGIQLGPNAFHCFDHLGVGEAARARAVYIDALRLMDAQSGQDIVEIPLGDAFRERMGNPYAVVHRAEMHKAFLDYCSDSPLVELRTNHRATGYDQDGNRVHLHLKNRASITGSVLIGAEGLHSPIRGQLVDDGPPRISGHTTYRSVIPSDQMPEDLRWNAATLWAGPKCHIVHYPLQDGRAFNLVVTYHRNMTEAVSGKPVSRDEVAVGFEHVCARARAIIERGQNWKQWVLCDREPISTWVDGRVALLGDAAHPMLQYFAQGACMAMEDAVCLAHMLHANADDPRAGLVAYQNRRVVRTARVQMNSRLIGDYIYHPDGAQAAVRDHVMKGKQAEDWYNDLAWLYGRDALELTGGTT